MKATTLQTMMNNNEILRNEIAAINTLKKENTDISQFFADHPIYFVSDGNTFGEYIFSTLFAARSGNGFLAYVTDGERPITPFYSKEQDICAIPSPDSSAVLPNAVVFFAMDCTAKTYENTAKRESVCALLENWLKICVDSENTRLVLLPIVLQPTSLPTGIKAVAEREYDYLLSRQKQYTAGEQVYLDAEKLCRTYVRDFGVDAVLLRSMNIFGPELDLIPEFSFRTFTEEIVAKKTIVIDNTDCTELFSAVYMADVATAAAVAAAFAKKGNIYQVTSMNVSLHLLKRFCFDNFREDFGLSCNITPGTVPADCGITALKLRKIGWKPAVNANESVYRTVAYYLGHSYDMLRCIPIYTGRLERIRQLELNTLKFVDKVCRENGIHYFLAGGSLLGAIRHGDMIPWDDDLDIGMLREDFEKFRKVCPGLVPENMTYASPQNDSGSHYQFDKIRLKNTYFSTNYSSHFRIHDGIFLDVIIYDQTSNSAWRANRQIGRVDRITKLLNVRWLGSARKGPLYSLRRIGVFFLKALPLSFYHWRFEHAVRHYEKKKNARYLIDGIGQNIRKGRFPKEWLTETEYVDFGELKAPIPKGYDGYLTHFYGPHYMELLPISQRTSGHRIARIDLGSYLCGNEPDPTFREADLDGELFEAEKED